MRFFFYGTLMAACGSPLGDAIRARLSPLGPARASGRLFAIPTSHGWYPALMRVSECEGEVLGEAYEAMPSFSLVDLARLDAYEGDEYRREPVAVVLPEGEDLAEAYVYRLDLPVGAVAIPHGNFADFLTLHGVKPYHEPGSAD